MIIYIFGMDTTLVRVRINFAWNIILGYPSHQSPLANLRLRIAKVTTFYRATKHTFKFTFGTAATHSNLSGNCASLSLPRAGNDNLNSFKICERDINSSGFAKLIFHLSTSFRFHIFRERGECVLSTNTPS